MSDTITTAPAETFFVAGGTLQRDASCYVQRGADDELYQAILRREFCYVLTSRQMGKSSLMVRTATRLREQGTAVAVLDLTAIGQNLTPEQWYDGLLSLMGQQLHLEEVLEDFWLENTRIAPLQRFLRAVREIVLVRVPGPVVLFVDEVDAVRSLPFSADEFFAAIRQLYNERTENPELHRLTFGLFGVASPADLIKDPRTTPFNIGTRIELTDFTDAEASPLAAGLDSADNGGQGAELLERILYWTGGHPYLTQRLCRLTVETLARQTDTAPSGAAFVDGLCEALFFSQRARGSEDNLLFVRERLLRSDADIPELLALYGKVWDGKSVPDDPANPLVGLLRLAGIVRNTGGTLIVRNRIYAKVFDPDWIKISMPDAEIRRQKAAYRRGVLRTVGISAVILLTMGILAFKAVSEARFAKEKATEAEKATLRANTKAEEAEKEKLRANAALLLANTRSEKIEKQAKELALRAQELERNRQELAKESQRSATHAREARKQANLAIREARKAQTNSERADLNAEQAQEARGRADHLRKIAERDEKAANAAEKIASESARRASDAAQELQVVRASLEELREKFDFVPKAPQTTLVSPETKTEALVLPAPEPLTKSAPRRVETGTKQKKSISFSLLPPVRSFLIGRNNKISFYIDSGREKISRLGGRILDTSGKEVTLLPVRIWDGKPEIGLPPNLPTGEYNVEVALYDKEVPDGKPLTAQTQVQIVKPIGGMALLIACDNYAGINPISLSWMSNDAEKLKKVLIEKYAYDTENIWTVYGTLNEGILVNRGEVGKGNPVSATAEDFGKVVDATVSQFKSGVLKKNAKHVVLFYGGHGTSDDTGQEVFLLPNAKQIPVHAWAQEICSVNPDLTVIGYYSACRDKSLAKAANSLSDDNYFAFRACDKGFSAYTDVRESDPSFLGLRQSFFGKALVDGLTQMAKTPKADWNVLNLHHIIEKNLEAIMRAAKRQNPIYAGFQKQPPFNGKVDLSPVYLDRLDKK